MIPDLTAYFDSHVSEKVQRDIVRFIVRGYRDADAQIKMNDYQPGPAKNLYPYVRWCRIEDYCLALSKYEDVETSSQPNAIRNSYYTLIKSGNVKLTISAVKSPADMPREAKFRNEYASLQYRFDVNVETDEFEIVDVSSVEEVLYAFILHGPVDKEDPHVPGFIRAGFPNERCTRYLGYIDLHERYKEVVQEVLYEGTEIVEDKAEVKLRTTSDIQGKLL